MSKLRVLLSKLKSALTPRPAMLPIALAMLLVSFLLLGGVALQRAASSGVFETIPALVAPAPQQGPTVTEPSYSTGKLEVKKRRVILLTSKNTIAFRGVVTGDSVAAAQAKIIKMSNALSRGEKLYLVLDTPGGSVDAGMRLIDMIDGLPQKVDTVTVFAASMGFHIVQHLNSRLILPSGTLMSHRARGGVEGQLPGELNTRVNFYMDELEKEDRFIAARIGLPYEKYRDLIRDEYWVGGETAIRDKMADEVVVARCDKDLDGTEDVEILTLFGKITLTYSTCPLVSEPLKIALAAEKDALPKLRDFAYTLVKSRRKFVNDYVMSGRLPEFVR
jgi:ATP-dependent Clp protease protease subunit